MIVPTRVVFVVVGCGGNSDDNWGVNSGGI